MVKVVVKWVKNKYDVDINEAEPGIVFKSQLYALTQVPIERQKILGLKGGMLKDDTDMSTLGIKDGQILTLMGTAEEVKLPEKPIEKVVFMEDLSESEQRGLTNAAPGGLSNLGNTCYMNSTLQCLRHVPELSQSLRNFSGSVGADGYSNLALAAKDLVSQLESSYGPQTPLAFWLVLRTVFPQFDQHDGKGHYAQQDAEECFGQLLFALSQKLSSSATTAMEADGKAPAAAASDSAENVIDKLFGVQMVSKLTCDEAPEEPATERSEKYRKLECHIGAETSNMEMGIKSSLQGNLEKTSPTLGRSAVYTKKSQVASLPPYLTVQFVRFFWKASAKVKSKILKQVTFPLVADFYDICADPLKEQMKEQRDLWRKQRDAETDRKKKAEKTEAAPSSSSAEGGAAAMETEGESEAKRQKLETVTGPLGFYELFAVLTHQGRDADSGHYVAWCKQADNVWVKFDDDKVSTVTDEDIKRLSGGGDWHMAYLCLYRAKKPDGSIVTPLL